MSWLTNPFPVPTAAKEITDPKEVKKLYDYWRLRIFYSMVLGYAFYYFTRKSFTFAMPGLIQDLGFDKAQLGFLATVLSLSYGLSKFLSGILADRSNARYFMAVGLMLTGFFNICFGLSSTITCFAIFWGLNGWFQGFGWPPCARLLTHWYSRSERGSWWSSWNASHNIGGALIPILCALCITYFGWRYAMFIPGVMCIGVGFLLINRLRDTPKSLGLPTIEKFRNDYSGVEQEDDGEELTTRQILFEHVLKNKLIWALAVAYLFVYMIRIGFNDWTALFLVETKGYSQMAANSCVSLFEIGGLVGSLIAGWASDYMFAARRGPVNALFAVAIVVCVMAFWYIPAGYALLDSLAIFFVGVAVFGPQMLIGVAAAELAHKKAAATSTGFIGWCAYIGSAAAGYPLGKVAQDFGWNGFFWVMVVCALLCVLLLLPLWAADRKASFQRPSSPQADAEPEVA